MQLVFFFWKWSKKERDFGCLGRERNHVSAKLWQNRIQLKKLKKKKKMREREEEKGHLWKNKMGDVLLIYMVSLMCKRKVDLLHYGFNVR